MNQGWEGKQPWRAHWRRADGRNQHKPRTEDVANAPSIATRIEGHPHQDAQETVSPLGTELVDMRAHGRHAKGKLVTP